ncbi:unnamed protein product [Gadus morhua 'NCC']
MTSDDSVAASTKKKKRVLQSAGQPLRVPPRPPVPHPTTPPRPCTNEEGIGRAVRERVVWETSKFRRADLLLLRKTEEGQPVVVVMCSVMCSGYRRSHFHCPGTSSPSLESEDIWVTSTTKPWGGRDGGGGGLL